MLRVALLAGSLLIGAAFGYLGLEAVASRPAAAARAPERVLVDVTAEARAQVFEGHCFLAEAGTLTATVQLVDTAARGVQPVRFGLGIAANVDAERIRTMVATAPVTYSIPVEAGTYCYSFHNGGPAPKLKERREATRQLVALRLTWSPPRP